MKAGGTIYHSVSPLSSQNPRLFFSEPKSSDNNRQTVEPFLTSVFHTQSPLTEVWTFPHSPWHSKLPASWLWQLLHANTHRDASQELTHTPAEMQINSWIDKEPTRWNVKTIWLDIPSAHMHSGSSLPPLHPCNKSIIFAVVFVKLWRCEWMFFSEIRRVITSN